MKKLLCHFWVLFLYLKSYGQINKPFQLPTNANGSSQFRDSVAVSGNASNILARVILWAEVHEKSANVDAAAGKLVHKGVFKFPVPMKVGYVPEIVDYDIIYQLAVDVADGRYIAILNDYYVQIVKNKSTYKTALKARSISVEESYNDLLETASTGMKDKMKMRLSENQAEHDRLLHIGIDFKSRELLTSLKNYLQNTGR